MRNKQSSTRNTTTANNNMFLGFRIKITAISTALSILILLFVFGVIGTNEYQSKMNFVEATLTEQINTAVESVMNGSAKRLDGIVISGEEAIYPFQNTTSTNSSSATKNKNLSISNQNENIIFNSNLLIDEPQYQTEIGVDSGFQSAKWIPILVYIIDYDKKKLIPFDTNEAELTKESLNRTTSTYIPISTGFWRDTNSKLCYVKLNTEIGDVIAFTDISSVDAYISNIQQTFTIISLATIAVIGLFYWIVAGFIIRPLYETWEKQRRFIADASHELKTPISVIMANCAVVLGDKNLSENARKWTETTLSEAESMKNLISDMLFLAMSDNDITVGAQEIDLGKQVQQNAMQFEARAFENGNTMDYFDIAKNVRVTMNPMNLSRVINILIDNACKYSHPGTEIQVKVHEHKKTAILLVSDVGEAISPEHEKAIFDRFYRVDDSRTGENGYGLGLAMAHDIITKAGGTITARTNPNSNITTFTVKLPKVID